MGIEDKIDEKAKQLAEEASESTKNEKKKTTNAVRVKTPGKTGGKRTSNPASTYDVYTRIPSTKGRSLGITPVPEGASGDVIGVMLNSTIKTKAESNRFYKNKWFKAAATGLVSLVVAGSLWLGLRDKPEQHVPVNESTAIISNIPLKDNIQLNYKNYIEQNNIKEIQKLHKATNIAPDLGFLHNTIQNEYISLIKEEKLEDFIQLREELKTGLTNNSRSEINTLIQNGYKICLRRAEFDVISEQAEILKIPLEEDTIQKCYSEIFLVFLSNYLDPLCKNLDLLSSIKEYSKVPIDKDRFKTTIAKLYSHLFEQYRTKHSASALIYHVPDDFFVLKHELVIPKAVFRKKDFSQDVKLEDIVGNLHVVNIKGSQDNHKLGDLSIDETKIAEISVNDNEKYHEFPYRISFKSDYYNVNIKISESKGINASLIIRILNLTGLSPSQKLVKQQLNHLINNKEYHEFNRLKQISEGDFSDGTVIEDRIEKPSKEFTSLLIPYMELDIVSLPRDKEDKYLVISKPDGSNQRKIECNKNNIISPIRWTPDRKHIFFSTDTGINSIVMVNVDTGKMFNRIYYKEGYSNHISDIDVSPNGNSIAYSLGQYKEVGIAHGNGIIQVSAYRSRDPKWSHDGKRLLLIEEGYKIGLLSSDSLKNSPDLIYNGSRELWEANWSPDNKQILFQEGLKEEKTGYDYTSIISIIDDTGQNYRELTAKENKCIYPVWSPDGKNIGYIRLSDSYNEIITKDLESGIERIISHNSKNKYFKMEWTPDGNNIIAYAALDDNVYSENFLSKHSMSEGTTVARIIKSIVYLMNNDGSNVRELRRERFLLE